MTRDKTDTKNKETLKRMQEKAARINAFTNEKRRKDDIVKMERIEREQLLSSQMKNDDDYMKKQEAKKEDKARNLKSMHENNLRTEKQRLQEQRHVQDVIDRDSLKQRI